MANAAQTIELPVPSLAWVVEHITGVGSKVHCALGKRALCGFTVTTGWAAVLPMPAKICKDCLRMAEEAVLSDAFAASPPATIKAPEFTVYMADIPHGTQHLRFTIGENDVMLQCVRDGEVLMSYSYGRAVVMSDV